MPRKKKKPVRKQDKRSVDLSGEIKKLQEEIDVEVLSMDQFLEQRKQYLKEQNEKKKQKTTKKVVFFDKEVEHNTGHGAIKRHKELYANAPLNMDDFIFDTFISLYKQGLYDINSLSLRVGKTKYEIEEMINSSPEKFEKFKEACEIASMNINKDDLVNRALKSLSKQIDGEDIIKENRYRFKGGKKVLFEQIEKNKGHNINATKMVLETFTDVFGKDMTPEKVGRLFISFNEYIYKETYDEELVNQLLHFQEGYLNQLFIDGGK